MIASSLKSVYNTDILIYEYDDTTKKVINTSTYKDGKIETTKVDDNKYIYHHVSLPMNSIDKPRYFDTVIKEYSIVYTGTTSNFIVFKTLHNAIASNILLLKNLRDAYNIEAERVINLRDKRFPEKKMKDIENFEEQNPEYFV